MRDSVKLTKGQTYVLEVLDHVSDATVDVKFIEENHGTITFEETDGTLYTLSKSLFASVLNLTQANAYTKGDGTKLIYTIYLKNGKFMSIHEKESLINTVLQFTDDEIVSFKENKELDVLMMTAEDDTDEAAITLTKKGANQVIAVLQSFVNKPE